MHVPGQLQRYAARGRPRGVRGLVIQQHDRRARGRTRQGSVEIGSRLAGGGRRAVGHADAHEGVAGAPQ